MGLSSLPTVSEGVFFVLIINTALSISMFKEIFRSILQVVGFRQAPADLDDTTADSYPLHLTPQSEPPSDEEFRSPIPAAVRFGSVFSCQAELECPVCLCRFEPESEVNRLSCGHLFHMECLNQWLDYWNLTCPLCRTPLMRDDEDCCPWF